MNDPADTGGGEYPLAMETVKKSMHVACP